MLGHVTHNSAQRTSLRAKRLGCQRLVGGGRGEARQTLKHDRAIPGTTAVQLHTSEMQ